MQLPGQTALVRELGVAPLTLRQALERLEQEGVIERRSRRGNFVRSREPSPQYELERLFDTQFRHAPIPIWLLDGRGRICETNPALQLLLGYSADELRGS